jgi:hypothetical protein
MLVGIEAAVEFWLALNWSPQAQWLRYSDPSGCLLVRHFGRVSGRRMLLCPLQWGPPSAIEPQRYHLHPSQHGEPRNTGASKASICTPDRCVVWHDRRKR